MITRPVMMLIGIALLGGCAGKVADFNREPNLTPVGSGLHPDRTAIAVNAPVQPPRADNSFWHDASADLFRDPRAARAGDVVTVKISINDNASFGNTSARSRDSSSNHSYDLNYNINTGGAAKKGDATVGGDAAAKTTTTGAGTIARSESIQLLVAAVVTDVLPNGNLVISGSQEVRVNFEVRVLSVAGVLRPRDIATDNTVSYDKIAEARISYGGRGRITEVQQPGWGQQIIDMVSPY